MLGNRWPHKPPLGYGIDGEHPLAQKLVLALPLVEGSGIPSFAVPAASPLTLGAGSFAPSWTTTSQGGSSLLFSGTASTYAAGTISLATLGMPTTGFSAAIGFQWFPGATANKCLLHFNQINASDFTNSLFVTSSTAVELFSATGTSVTWSGTPNNQTTFIHGLLTYDGATAHWYSGGVDQGAKSISSSVAMGIPVLGSNFAGTGAIYPGSAWVSYLYLWGRLLSAPEAAALVTDPWQMFRTRRTQALFAPLAGTPPTYALSGPSSGIVGRVSSSFTLTPNLTVASDTITFSDGSQGGTFTPTSLTFTSSSAPQTFTYTPAATGLKSLTPISSGGHQVNGSPATFLATPAPVGYTVSGPSTSATGAPSAAFTLTPGATVVSDTITFSDGAHGGTFTPTSLTFTNSSVPQTFTYAAPTSGSKTLTLTSVDSGIITGSPTSLTATAIGHTLVGPSTAATGAASANFTVTPASATTDVITFSDGSHGGTFTPTSLTFTASSAPQTFTYTAPTSGTKTLTPTSADGGTISGSPASLTVTAVSFVLAGPSSGIAGVPSTNFTLTPVGLTTDTITFSDGSQGGVFTPSSFTFPASSAPQTFTYTATKPGTKTLTLTSADGATISGSPASFVPGLPQGSIRFFNHCTFATASNTLLNGSTAATIAYRVQFNSSYPSGAGTVFLLTKAGVPLLWLDSNGTHVGEFDLSMTGATAGGFTFTTPFAVGVPNHVVISWASGAQAVFVNGTLVFSGSAASATGSLTGPIIVGPASAVQVDFQISDLAIWNTYAAVAADARNLYAGIYTPLTLTNSGTTYAASAWFPLGGVTGTAPTFADAGLADWTGNGNTFTGSTPGSPSTSLAVYAGPLGFTPPVEVSAYVGKSGKLAHFFPVLSVPTANGYYPPQVVTAVGANPTITWKGNTIQADGPIWAATSQSLLFASYRLQCGTVQSVGITNGGVASYTAPSVSATTADGHGVAPTFGTPTLGVGVISYSLSGVGTYGQYTGIPAVAMSGGTYTMPPSVRGVLTGSTASVVPMVGGILGCGSGVTAAPSYTLSGGVGAGATATVVPVGGIAFLTPTAIGSGYTAGSVAVTISDSGSGAGATATATVGGGGPGTGAVPGAVTVVGSAITAIGAGSGGSNYTANPTVVIAGTGTGAIITATVNTSGAITGYTVVYGGTGYTGTPTASVVCGAITGLTLATAGAGYSGPSVAITNTGSGSGSGATASATQWVAGGIAQPLVTAGGSGYAVHGTTAAISGGSGTGATVAVTVNSSGVVTGLAPTALGTSYTGNPTYTISGTGTGATASGTFCRSGGIAALTFVAGSGYSATATTATVLDTQGGTGTGATVQWTLSATGAFTGLAPSASGTGYTAPFLRIQPGTGSGASATATVSGGVITGSTSLVGGSGYGLRTSVLVVDPTGTGAAFTATVSGGVVTAITLTAGGSGYSAHPTIVVIDGAQASVAPLVGNYIQSVPVATSGSGLTSLPVISISDSTGSGAVLTAVMTGAAPGDVLSFTAAWGWLQSVAGSAISSPPPGSSTPASIANFAGTTEGQAGLLAALPAPGPFKLGTNMSGGQADYTLSSTTFRNYVKKFGFDSPWVPTSGTITTLVDGTPYSWTVPSATLKAEIYSTNVLNPVDNKGTPSLFGTWTITYTDVNAGTSNAAILGLTTITGTIASGPTKVISGNNVSITYVITAPANVFNIVLRVTYSQPNFSAPGTQWTISNLCVIPPNNPTSPPPVLAADQNVINWLTTPSKNIPAVIRYMDVNSDYGITNYIDPGDLSQPTSLSWSQYPISANPPHNSGGANLDPLGTPILSGTATFTSYRTYNTNPALGPGPTGNGTYGWVSPNLYFNSSWGATWGVSGTDSFGAYVTIPPTDMGLYAVGNFNGNAGATVPVELVSPVPHGLRTGQILQTTSGSPSIAVVGTTAMIGLNNLSQTNSSGGAVCYVTGPNTIVVTPQLNLNSPTTPTSSFVSPVSTPGNAPVAISPGFQMTVQVPFGNLIPFEFSAATASQLGSNLHISIPGMASDSCSLAIAQRVAANLTPGLKVYAEYMNEHWNNTMNGALAVFLSTLVGRLPNGTPIGNYYTTNGQPLNKSQFYTIQAARHHDIWVNYFTSLGRGSDVVRYFAGLFATGSSPNASVLQTATQYKIPMNMFSGGPYNAVSADTPFAAASTPAGGVGTPGNWPADAINDFAKHAIYYREPFWIAYAQASSWAATLGQPPTGAVCTIAATTGGTLAAGVYLAFYTFTTSSGETTIGLSQSNAISVALGNVVQVTFPIVPTWATGVNLYLTPPNAFPGTQVLYASGITTLTYLVTSNTWQNASLQPPTTNGVAWPSAPPQNAAYEFAVSQILPNSVPFHPQIDRDIWSHPSFYDVNTMLFRSVQVGNPGVANSGCTVGSFYELCRQYTPGQDWALAISTAQSPGYGGSNQYATAQGGAPADNLSHDASNQSVALQAFRDWLDATAPPAPTVSSTVPVSSAAGVLIGSSIVANFSAAVSPSSLSFTVAATVGGANVPGNASLDVTGTIATFRPARPVALDTGYTATVDAVGANGESMASAYSWSWTSQVPAPTITVTGILELGFQFSSGTIGTGITITAVVSATQANYPGTTTWNSGTYFATFTPTSPFVVGTKYIITISGATAPDGTPMAPITYVFTPGAARAGASWFGGLGKPTARA